MQRIVAITGIPASGKSTLGLHIAQALGFAFLDKDTFLEQLFQQEKVVSQDQRRVLSRHADILFEHASRSEPCAVLVSWWRHPALSHESGTRTWWAADAGIQAIEVHCICPSRVAAERFACRQRHAGHLDRALEPRDVEALCAERAALGPIHPSKAIVHDTVHEATESSLACLVAEIRERMIAESMA